MIRRGICEIGGLMSARLHAVLIFGLAVGCLGGCLGGCTGAGGGTRVPVSISVSAEIGGREVSCDAIPDSGLQLRDLKFFVSDLALLGRDGRVVPVELFEDGRWQNGRVALLDFEDGSGSCANGSISVRMAVDGTVPAGEYTGVEFHVGVPFDLNHANPALASAPLTLGRMHWGWQAGYKFFRLDTNLEGQAFSLHIGSTGCSGAIGDISDCRRSNRPHIRLAGFDPAGDEIVLKLDALLPAHGKVESCQSGFDDVACRLPFAALGLDLDTGLATRSQTAFEVRSL